MSGFWLTGFAALWWGLAVLFLVASFIAALLFPHLPWQGPETQPLRPVTAIVPLKHFNPAFVADQTSLFTQDYSGLEILFTSAEPESLALAAARQILERFPAVPSKMMFSDVTEAASPKLNNLWPAVGAARNDLILTKDCNIRLMPGDLENLVHHHGPGVGLVSTITITTDPQSFGAWIEASIINAYHARMLMLASALGLGVGCGKIMLFSREGLERAGGLKNLAWAIGEDEAMQQAFEKIGLRTVLSDRTSRQVLGYRSLAAVWQRQLRWMLIWRLQTPAVFVGDLLGGALPAALAAWVAAHLLGLPPWMAGAATLALWFALESLLCLIKGWPLSFWSLPAFFGREILDIAVHVRALTTRHIAWGGATHRVNRKAAP